MPKIKITPIQKSKKIIVQTKKNSTAHAVFVVARSFAAACEIAVCRRPLLHRNFTAFAQFFLFSFLFSFLLTGKPDRQSVSLRGQRNYAEA